MYQPNLSTNPLTSNYAALPEAVRQYYTEQEYLWLSDRQKADLERSNCEPDEEE